MKCLFKQGVQAYHVSVAPEVILSSLNTVLVMHIYHSIKFAVGFIREGVEVAIIKIVRYF